MVCGVRAVVCGVLPCLALPPGLAPGLAWPCPGLAWPLVLARLCERSAVCSSKFNPRERTAISSFTSHCLAPSNFQLRQFALLGTASQGLKSPRTNCREKTNSCNKVLQNYSKGFFCFSVGHEKYDYYYYYEKSFFCSFKREPLREKEQNREEVRSTYGFRFSSAQEGLKVHSI